MHKFCKRVLILALSVALLVTMTPMPAFAADTVTSQGQAQEQADNQEEGTKPETEKKETEEPEKESVSGETDSVSESSENSVSDSDGQKDSTDSEPSGGSESEKDTAKEEDSQEHSKAESSEVTDDSAKEKEKDKKKEEEKYPAQTITAYAGDVKVTLKAPEGSLPKGTTLDAHQVGQKYIDAVAESLEDQGRDLTDAVAIDVTPLDKDGKEVQPKKDVSVTFSGTDLDEKKGDTIEVYRVSDNASEVTQVPGGGTADSQTFTANHFTIYVGANANDPNGDGSGANTASNPKTIDYGQTITLTASNEASTWGILSDPTEKPSKGSESHSLNGVTITNLDRTHADVTNNSTSTSEKIYVIHHHAGDSDSRDDYYIKVMPAPNLKTVTFKLQDAAETSWSTAAEESVQAGGSVTAPTEPEEKEVNNKKYEFSGWCTDEACTTPATPGDFTNITSDKEFYAKYTLEPEVTFNFMDAGADSFVVDSTQQVKSGTGATAPSKDAEKTAGGKTYTFTGWCSDQACTTAADLSNITADTQVYGKYVPKEVTVKYNLTDAGASSSTVVKTETIDSGSSTTPPVQPEEKEVNNKKYEFSGWCTDEACTTPATADDFADITSDKEFYAKYTLEPEVTFNFMDAGSSSFVVDSSVQVKSGGSTTAPYKPDEKEASNKKYEFSGWCTDEACTTPATADDYANITSDKDFYAKYTLEPEVTFNFMDAGSDSFVVDSTQQVKSGTGATAPSKDAEKTVGGKKYEFSGWCSDQACTTAADLSNITADTQVYGKYTLEKHTVTFNLMDAGETSFTNIHESSVPSGSDVTDAPSEDSPKMVDNIQYVFSGWCSDQACTTAADLTNITGDKDVYGKYTVADITVKFNLTDAGASSSSVVQTDNIKSGGSVTAPSEVDEKTVEGKKYEFTGWCSDEACTTPVSSDAFSNIPADTEFYGKYVIEPEVTFNLMDAGSSSFAVDSTQQVKSGSSATAPEESDEKETQDGKKYEFSGWCSDEACTTAADLSNITEDTQVYGKYTLKNHTVTFNLMDAGETSFTNIHESTVPSGDDVTDAPVEPDEKTVDNIIYSFSGWCSDEACTTAADLTNITDDKQVYGKYEKKKLKVTFMFKDAGSDDFVNEQESTVSYGDDVTDAPVHADTDTHFFIGWCTDETCETEADLTGIKADMTVYGKYSRKVSLSYHPNTTDAVVLPDPNPVIVPEGSKVTLGSATRTGYILTGWSTEREGTAENTYDPGAEITIDEDTIVYAQWEKEATLTITYHNNYDITPEEFDKEDVTANTVVQLINERPERENYLFSGWAEDPDADKPDYVPNEKFKVGSESVDLYAVWYPVPDNVNLGHKTLTAYGDSEVTYNGQEQELYYKTVTGHDGVTANCGVKETDFSPTQGDYKYGGYVRVGNIGDDPNHHHVYAKVDTILAKGTDAGIYSTPVVAQLYTHNSNTNEFEPLKHGPNDEYDAYIAVLNGNLIINPVDVTFSTKSASKYYDGTPLTADGTATFKIGEQDVEKTFTHAGTTITLVNGEKLNVRTTGSQTNKGTSMNGYEIAWGNPSDAWGGQFPNSTAKQSNYNIVTGQMGTLEVKVNQATYNANAGTDTVTDMPSPNPEDAGTTYNLSSSEPKRDHYTFDGWNTETGGGGDSYAPGSSYTFPSNVHSVTFYAQWVIDKHKVTYDPNGGEYDGKTTPTVVSNIPYNTQINIADSADREHYDFKGWKETGGNIYAPGAPYTVKKDTEFKAQWALHEHDLTFDPNGGKFDGKTTPTTEKETYGKTIKIPEAATKEKARFLGWLSNGTLYQPGDDYEVEDDAEFVAQWVDILDLTFDPTGGVFRDSEDPTGIEYEKGSEFVIPEAATREHYTFKEWNTKKDGDGQSYDPGDEDEFQEAKTFFAIWEIDKHKVTYDPNGGEYDGKTTPTVVSDIPYNTEINIADAAVRDHYDFKGWKETGGNTYDPGDPYTVKKDTEFKAQWEVHKQKITFDPNGGTFDGKTEPTTVEEPYDKKIKVPKAATKEKSKFLGWLSGGKLYQPGDDYEVTGDATFEAQWVDIIEVIYDPEGGDFRGSDKATKIEYEKGAAITVPEAAVKDHYKFKAWNTKADGSGKAYQPGDEIEVAEDGMEFFAIWERIERKITYDPNGGVFRGSKDPTVIKYNDGEKISIAEAPTREGYTFLYWKGSAYQPGDDYTVTENHVFVAQWKKNETPKPDPDKPKHKKKGKKSVKPKAVKTGDPVNLELGVILLITSALLCIALFRRRKQRG